MTARRSAKINPAGDTPRRVADALSILDDNTLVEFTPASASDATAENVKFAYGFDYGLTSGGYYLHVQITTGNWKKAALS